RRRRHPSRARARAAQGWLVHASSGDAPPGDRALHRAAWHSRRAPGAGPRLAIAPHSGEEGVRRGAVEEHDMNEPNRSPSAASGESQVLTEIGPQLLVRLAVLIRTARTHEVTNQAFQRQLQELLATLSRGLEEESEVELV